MANVTTGSLSTRQLRAPDEPLSDPKDRDVVQIAAVWRCSIGMDRSPVGVGVCSRRHGDGRFGLCAEGLRLTCGPGR